MTTKECTVPAPHRLWSLPMVDARFVFVCSGCDDTFELVAGDYPELYGYDPYTVRTKVASMLGGVYMGKKPSDRSLEVTS